MILHLRQHLCKLKAIWTNPKIPGPVQGPFHTGIEEKFLPMLKLKNVCSIYVYFYVTTHLVWPHQTCLDNSRPLFLKIITNIRYPRLFQQCSASLVVSTFGFRARDQGFKSLHSPQYHHSQGSSEILQSLMGDCIVNRTGLFRSVPWCSRVCPYGFRTSELGRKDEMNEFRNQLRRPVFRALRCA